MAIQKHSLDGTSAAIYAQTENINYFLNSPLAPDSASGVENRTRAVPQRSVRRYPGDPTPYTVAPTTAVFIHDPGRRNGSATPGRQMILDDGVEKRSFTYTGPWTDVHSFLVGAAKMDLKAYSSSARYDIATASEAQVPAGRSR